MMLCVKVPLTLAVVLWAAQSGAEGTVRSVDSDSGADTRVETSSSASAGSRVASEQAAVAASTAAGSGPSIELIIGGSSTEGAAHVGRMPVLD